MRLNLRAFFNGNCAPELSIAIPINYTSRWIKPFKQTNACTSLYVAIGAGRFVPVNVLLE